jgi:hypothetical protein
MLRDEQEQKKLVFGQQVLDSLRGLHGEGNWLVERALDLGLVTVDPLGQVKLVPEEIPEPLHLLKLGWNVEFGPHTHEHGFYCLIYRHGERPGDTCWDESAHGDTPEQAYKAAYERFVRLQTNHLSNSQ